MTKYGQMIMPIGVVLILQCFNTAQAVTLQDLILGNDSPTYRISPQLRQNYQTDQRFARSVYRPGLYRVIDELNPDRRGWMQVNQGQIQRISFDCSSSLAAMSRCNGRPPGLVSSYLERQQQRRVLAGAGAGAGSVAPNYQAINSGQLSTDGYQWGEYLGGTKDVNGYYAQPFSAQQFNGSSMKYGEIRYNANGSTVTYFVVRNRIVGSSVN